MKTSELMAIVSGMTKEPWKTERSDVGAHCVVIATTAPGQCIYSAGLQGGTPEGDRQGIAALRNHADALVGMLEAVEQVLSPGDPNQDAAARRALRAAYERCMAVP